MAEKRDPSFERQGKRIRITATPSTNGPIPVEIRRHWVGIEMQTVTLEQAIARFPKHRTWYEDRRDYYHVPLADAISSLKTAGRPGEVIEFWESMAGVFGNKSLLSFEPKVCVELT